MVRVVEPSTRRCMAEGMNSTSSTRAFRASTYSTTTAAGPRRGEDAGDRTDEATKGSGMTPTTKHTHTSS